MVLLDVLPAPASVTHLNPGNGVDFPHSRPLASDFPHVLKVVHKPSTDPDLLVRVHESVENRLVPCVERAGAGSRFHDDRLRDCLIRAAG